MAGCKQVELIWRNLNAALIVGMFHCSVTCDRVQWCNLHKDVVTLCTMLYTFPRDAARASPLAFYMCLPGVMIGAQ